MGVDEGTKRLRRAAAQLRSSVKCANPGPWHAYRDCGIVSVKTLAESDPVCTDAEENGSWIGLMSPALAEPLAAWLEKTADSMEGPWDWVAVDEALAVADVLLERLQRQSPGGVPCPTPSPSVPPPAGS